MVNRFIQFDSTGFSSVSVDSTKHFGFTDIKGSAFINYLKPALYRDTIQYSVRIFDAQNGISGNNTDTLIILP